MPAWGGKIRSSCWRGSPRRYAGVAPPHDLRFYAAAAALILRLSRRQWFVLAIVATLAFRFWLAARVPITNDEAYFIEWGRHPALGYYDHPPMIGWLLAALAPWSEFALVVRLPALVLPVLLALLARAAVRAAGATQDGVAELAAIAVLLVPMDFWDVFITTDIPLAFFSVLSLALFARAARRDSLPTFFAAGIAFGFAFLSKYLAVLLGPAFIAWALLARRAPRRWAGLGLTLLGALPAGLFNLAWNYEHCWANVMFNAINRNEDAALTLANPLLYALSLAYLAGPLLYFAWRERRRIAELAARPDHLAWLLGWVVPFALLALVALGKRVGLHWMLSFVPALVVSAALAIGRARLARAVRFFAAFAALHALVIAAFIIVPLTAWKSWALYPRLVFVADTPELLAKVKPWLGEYRLASDSYSSAAVLSYHARAHVAVFGEGSSHARQDDLLSDPRSWDGRNILILRRSAPPLAEYQPYFESVEERSIEVRGATFHAYLGRGFKYQPYRERVLAEVRERYYRIPRWLPIGRCYFCARYFPGMACRG